MDPPKKMSASGAPGPSWEEVKAGPAVPMSVSMRCIIMLTVQFFAIGTVVELIRTAGRFGAYLFFWKSKCFESKFTVVSVKEDSNKRVRQELSGRVWPVLPFIIECTHWKNAFYATTILVVHIVQF